MLRTRGRESLLDHAPAIGAWTKKNSLRCSHGEHLVSPLQKKHLSKPFREMKSIRLICWKLRGLDVTRREHAINLSCAHASPAVDNSFNPLSLIFGTLSAIRLPCLYESPCMNSCASIIRLARPKGKQRISPSEDGALRGTLDRREKCSGVVQFTKSMPRMSGPMLRMNHVHVRTNIG